MSVLELLKLIEDESTPVYLSYMGAEEKEQQIKLYPRCDLLASAFSDCLVKSVLPISEDGGNDYGGGLVITLATKVELLKKN